LGRNPDPKRAATVHYKLIVVQAPVRCAHMLPEGEATFLAAIRGLCCRCKTLKRRVAVKWECAQAGALDLDGSRSFDYIGRMVTRQTQEHLSFSFGHAASASIYIKRSPDFCVTLVTPLSCDSINIRVIVGGSERARVAEPKAVVHLTHHRKVKRASRRIFHQPHLALSFRGRRLRRQKYRPRCQPTQTRARNPRYPSKMQLSSLLFALPAFLSNLTNPTGTESSPVTSPTFEMPTPISYILPKLPYEYNVRSPPTFLP